LLAKAVADKEAGSHEIPHGLERRPNFFFRINAKNSKHIKEPQPPTFLQSNACRGELPIRVSNLFLPCRHLDRFPCASNCPIFDQRRNVRFAK
jgi:hypothetical protein